MQSGQALFLLSCLKAALVHQAHAQSDTSLSFSNSLPTISLASGTLSTPTGTYTETTGQVHVVTASYLTISGHNASVVATAATVSSNSQVTTSTTSHSLTVINGNTPASPSSGNNSTATSSSVRPSSTVPCNGSPELCDRKYSNITNVCSHNSAFVVKNNIASNQMLSVINQLDDGIRMLQGETHYVNGTIWNCHTSCDLLNAGTWQSELETVTQWLHANPYDVITILISNSDQTSVEHYVPSIADAGLLPYVYTPAYVPQYREQWPTLGEMILRNQRLVFFMDYKANQSAVPYILDQYSHLLQTPFSPTDRNFPCTIDYPTGVNETDFRERFMYLANHNLNQAVDVSTILGTNVGTVLVPNTAELNVTNAQGFQFGELGAMTSNCTSNWNRPPNFLVVDYYNVGSPMAGSVFQVAAMANNVTDTKQCCGSNSRSTGSVVRSTCGWLTIALSLMVVVL